MLATTTPTPFFIEGWEVAKSRKFGNAVVHYWWLRDTVMAKHLGSIWISLMPWNPQLETSVTHSFLTCAAEPPWNTEIALRIPTSVWAKIKLLKFPNHQKTTLFIPKKVARKGMANKLGVRFSCRSCQNGEICPTCIFVHHTKTDCIAGLKSLVGLHRKLFDAYLEPCRVSPLRNSVDLGTRLNDIPASKNCRTAPHHRFLFSDMAKTLAQQAWSLPVAGFGIFL